MYNFEIDEDQIRGTVETANLELLGLTQQTERSLSTFQIICGGWNICNSWAGIVGTLAIGISQGGTVLLLYGIIIVMVIVGLCTATLAELSSVYPTAGGQYHWTSILSPAKCSRVLVRKAPSSLFVATDLGSRAIAVEQSTSLAGSQSALVSLSSLPNLSFPWWSTTTQPTILGHGTLF